MTTAHTETPTERVPGRAWTIRLTGHNDRYATVTCTTTACRMPPRSKDLAALRAFAAQHAAAHAKAATVRPNAWCHCGSQQCSAHTEPVHCAGSVVLIVPTVGQVWSVEEVCAQCAPLIPHATVAARAARPHRTVEQPAAAVPAPARAGVPSGFSSPDTAPADGAPAPGRRSGRRPPRPQRRRTDQR